MEPATGQTSSSAEPEVNGLRAKIAALESELDDLHMLHETIIEHGTSLENELIDLVGTLDKVSEELERGEFNPQSLSHLVDRQDELGQIGRVFNTLGNEVIARERRLRMLRVVIPAGVALSAMKDFHSLLETIVIEAQRLCNADGGVLFLLRDEKRLDVVIARFDSLSMVQGGANGAAISYPPVMLYDAAGQPNCQVMAARAVHEHHLVNIADIYQAPAYDTSALRAFDQQLGYHSTSLLALPLEGENHEVIGVLQIINARDTQTGQITGFTPDDVIDTLVLLGSAALSSYKREDSLRKEIDKLRIEIDMARRDSQIAEITETDYFQQLQQRARELRKR